MDLRSLNDNAALRHLIYAPAGEVSRGATFAPAPYTGTAVSLDAPGISIPAMHSR
jgi:hypothetical protein